jgi:hypothetical protein
MDYAMTIRNGIRLYRTWLEPGNKLQIYNSVENRGIYKATDGKSHQVKYEITDAYGNETSLSFTIQSKEYNIGVQEPKGELFRYDQNNRIKNKELDFSVPEGALYDDVDFIYTKKPSLPGFYSPVYQLDEPTVALHYACPFKIKAANLPARLRDKVMLAQINPVSGKIVSATGKFEDGWVEGNIRTLGDYTLAVDTISPQITPVINKGKKKQPDTNVLKFKITDNLSGIDTYRGTIDGKWVLFEYDMKNNLISYTFDKSRIQLGKKHILNLEVTDFKGNKRTYKSTFSK